jgi:hypothetical protein
MSHFANANILFFIAFFAFQAAMKFAKWDIAKPNISWRLFLASPGIDGFRAE